MTAAVKPKTDAASRAATRRALAESLGYATEADFAALAGVKVDTVIDWRRRGEGPPYVKLGTTILYPHVALAEYLHAHVRRVNAEPALL